MRNSLQFHKELLQTIAWQILPSYARRACSTILANKLDGVGFDSLEEELVAQEVQYFLCREKGGAITKEQTLLEEHSGGHEPSGVSASAYDEVIDVIKVRGAITRNGGACAMGSIDIREMLKQAAQVPNCIGHILIMDSPGGSASSCYDFKMGVDAVREAGQPIIGLIDGMCASACLRLAVMLDEVYYMHPMNQIGSVGTMAMFETMKDGDENSVTHSVYHEVYADASVNKNSPFRKIASGDDSEVKEMLNKCNDEFMAEVRALRPNVTDEMLSGKMYDCSEVVGVLVEGQSDFEGCVERIHALRGEQNANPTAEPKPEPEPVPEPPVPEPKPQPTNNQTKNSIVMNIENIKNIIGDVEVSEEGFFLNADLADQIDAKLAEQTSAIAEHATEVENLNATIADNSAKAEALEAQLKEAQQQIDTLGQQIVEKSKEIENLNTVHAEELAAKDKAIEEANAVHAEELAKKDAEIEELSHAAPAQSAPAPATAQEGENDGQEQQKVANISEMGLSRQEMIDKFKERAARLGL